MAGWRQSFVDRRKDGCGRDEGAATGVRNLDASRSLPIVIGSGGSRSCAAFCVVTPWLLAISACGPADHKLSKPTPQFLESPSDKSVNEYAECVRETMVSHHVLISPLANGGVSIQGDQATTAEWHIGVVLSLIGRKSVVLIRPGSSPSPEVLALLRACQ